MTSFGKHFLPEQGCFFSGFTNTILLKDVLGIQHCSIFLILWMQSVVLAITYFIFKQNNYSKYITIEGQNGYKKLNNPLLTD